MRTEFIEQAAKKYAKTEEMLKPIVEALNDEGLYPKHLFQNVGPWKIAPPDPTLDFMPRQIYIGADVAGVGRLEIACQRGEYGLEGKFEFRASRWPEYWDEHGNKHTCHPTDLYIKSTSPTTRAAEGRDPKAIARQICTNLINEYVRLYRTCKEIAKEKQLFHDKNADAVTQLQKATGDKGSAWANVYPRTFYIKDLAGDPVRLEFRGTKSVRLDVSTAEAVEIVKLLRAMRKEEAAA